MTKLFYFHPFRIEMQLIIDYHHRLKMNIKLHFSLNVSNLMLLRIKRICVIVFFPTNIQVLKNTIPFILKPILIFSQKSLNQSDVHMRFTFCFRLTQKNSLPFDYRAHKINHLYDLEYFRKEKSFGNQSNQQILVPKGIFYTATTTYLQIHIE